MSSTLNKAEMIKVIASQTGQKVETVKQMLDTFFQATYHNLAAGRSVKLRGFGTFEVKIGKPRVGRNPNHPERGQVSIPARPVVRFRMGHELKASAQLQATA